MVGRTLAWEDVHIPAPGTRGSVQLHGRDSRVQVELKGPRPGDDHPGLSHGPSVITGSFHVEGEAGKSVAEKR